MPILTAAASVVSPSRKPYTSDPERLAFYRDLVEPFGEPVDEEVLRAGPQISHHDLLDRLVANAGPSERLRPDLIVLAHSLPDLHPFSVPGPRLNHLLGGGATSVGISQQGLAAPFTAVRVVAGYQKAGRCGDAVVGVLEQTTLPTRFALAHETPLVDSGVLLVLGRDPEPGHVSKAGADAAAGPRIGEVEALGTHVSPAVRLTELAEADVEGTLIVLGPWFKDDALPDKLRTYRANRGTYCTSVWLTLARHWQTWRQKYKTVVLCDTEPRTGVSHLAVLR
ncbi:hypothetical protein [Streptomyces sp. 7N604]|uniref:hypothetical protein n=1 Tax=Streptomyces sp. 7N604 TaxID=3457415 RepID=UPI003FD6B486